MAIAPNTRLGPYEIVESIGTGGMGEVFRARDPRLGRDVAIKVLSALQSTLPDVRKRFEQEARTISSLQHPHICTVFDIGNQDGVDYLVMEFLEGETLEKRLQRGPLPLAQALLFSIQIADAIAQAHRHAIVHRDVKPGNIMLTKSGAKLLDFGLAKLQPAAPSVTSHSALPTNAALTAEGTILGTLQYMAPEQVEAQEPDARTDIFAFGAVLYEMVTGKKAFEGKTQASLIASIMERQPVNVSEVRQEPQPELDRLIYGCLAKNPDERWQNAYDVLKQLKGIAEAPHWPGQGVRRERSRGWLAFIVIGALAPVLAAFWIGWNLSAPDARPTFVSVPPPFESFGGDPVPVISPDGKMICFQAPDETGKVQLWIRPLDSGVARPLPQTREGNGAFWSPDSRSIAFFASRKLWRMDVNAGSPQEIADAPSPRGGAWGSDNVILFVPVSGSGLYRVDASGGRPATTVTKLDASHQEVRHGYPSFLPDGDHFLYWVRSPDPQFLGTYVGSVKAPEFKHRVGDLGWSYAEYRNGYLLFARNNDIFAQAFDLKSFDVTGESQRVAEGASGVLGFNLYWMSVSENGVLVYPTGSLIALSQLTSFDREGRKLGSVSPQKSFFAIALSPDEKRIAAEIYDSKNNTWDIWMVELDGSLSRFTTTLDGTTPVWSSDGETVLFSRLAESLHFRSLRGSRVEDMPQILANTGKWPMSWSTDKSVVLFGTNSPSTGTDLWSVPLSGENPVPYVNTEFNEYQGTLAPNSHTVAYTSDESRRAEVYIDSFPKSGNKIRVSRNGGSLPRWRSDGKELFYISADGKLMAASISLNNGVYSVTISPPLFQAPPLRDDPFRPAYAVADKGTRFIFNTPVPDGSPRGVNVVLNWQGILKPK